MDQPQGSYIQQSFSLSSGGTFKASDDHGNSFAFTVPIAAAGLSSTTLVGNSTAAVLETRVTAGPATLADVRLTFSVYDQSCQPAGVRLYGQSLSCIEGSLLGTPVLKSSLSSIGNEIFHSRTDE